MGRHSINYNISTPLTARLSEVNSCLSLATPVQCTYIMMRGELEATCCERGGLLGLFMNKKGW